MAKIVMEFDSVDKTWSVMQDGKALDNVTSLSVYNMKDYMSGEEMGCCNINMMSDDEENDIKTYEQLSCSKNEDGNREFPEHKVLTNFVVKAKQSPTTSKIGEYLSGFFGR